MATSRKTPSKPASNPKGAGSPVPPKTALTEADIEAQVAATEAALAAADANDPEANDPNILPTGNTVAAPKLPGPAAPAEPEEVAVAGETVVHENRAAHAETVTGPPRPASTENPHPPARDLSVLHRLANPLANTITPYPAATPEPDPVNLLGEPRATRTWMPDETAEPVTGRVLTDGWRVRIGKNYYSARRGDRVTLPRDIANLGASRGTFLIETPTDG